MEITVIVRVGIFPEQRGVAFIIRRVMYVELHPRYQGES